MQKLPVSGPPHSLLKGSAAVYVLQRLGGCEYRGVGSGPPLQGQHLSWCRSTHEGQQVLASSLPFGPPLARGVKDPLRVRVPAEALVTEP